MAPNHHTHAPALDYQRLRRGPGCSSGVDGLLNRTWARLYPVQRRLGWEKGQGGCYDASLAP